MHEGAERVLKALSDLWSATDYPEAYDLSGYGLDELKRIAGQWEQVRKACDKLYWSIRDAYPGIEGDFPIGGPGPLAGFERSAPD